MTVAQEELITITISHEAEVYGCPPRTPGTVAPTGETAAFRAIGSPRDVLRAYAEWERCPVVSRRGLEYPRRMLRGLRIVPAVAERVARARGLSYGAVVGEIWRLARDCGVANP